MGIGHLRGISYGLIVAPARGYVKPLTMDNRGGVYTNDIEGNRKINGD